MIEYLKKKKEKENIDLNFTLRKIDEARNYFI